MKRKDLLAHLIRHGCMMVREGGRHTVYFNPKTKFSLTDIDWAPKLDIVLFF